MKFVKFIFLTLLWLFLLFVALGMAGAWDSTESPEHHKQEACRRGWEDAAPGAEKRTARAMCDAMGVKP